ncbi:MAG: InlB B-repeat-containing protein, partial [Oscillospiraceae bacterium]
SPALPSPSPALAKTDAPTTAMATVAKETAIQPSVSFVLDNQTAYTDTAIWAVYDSETATTALVDIVASCNANTLTLTHKTDLPVAVYYVAVTESGKAESARLALMVSEKVAPVALMGAAPVAANGNARNIGSGGTGARSYTNAAGDLFLGGNYIEIGISEIGSLGTSSNAPTKARPVRSIFYHPTHIKIGLRSIGGGWETGAKDTTRDFFLPGTIDEGFMTFWGASPIYQSGGCHIGNNIAKDKNITSTGTVDHSTPSLLKGITSGTMNNVLDYVQEISFKADDKQFKTVVTLTNNSAAPLDNLYYIRRLDPDQGLNGNNTDNYFLSDEAGGTWCVASTAPLDGTSKLLRPIDRHTAFSRCENVFSFYTDDLRAEPITGELAFTDLGGNYVGNAALDGNHFYDDKAIGLRFNIGTLAPGASTELTYYTSLNPDVEGAVSRAEDVVINITQQPIVRTFVEGGIEGKLRTRGTVLIAGASAPLSYQWYQNTSASNVGGMPIPGATGYDFEIPTSLQATTDYYYYCVVSAGGKSVPSQIATICIVPAGTSIYTVKFDSNSTGTVTGMQRKQTVANGRSVVSVRDPKCTNATQSYFNGWYKTAAAADADLWDFADPVTSDMTLYAGWIKPPTLNITTASLLDAREGFAYTQNIDADYTGKKALAYSAVGLPSGFSIDATTGTITGNPAVGTSRSAP